MKIIRLNFGPERRELERKGWYIPSTSFIAFIDDEDYDRVSPLNWSTSRAGNRYYARNKKTLMHRFVLQVQDDVSNRWHVHHIDGNGLNNSKGNLRVLSPREHLLIHQPRRSRRSYYVQTWSQSNATPLQS